MVLETIPDRLEELKESYFQDLFERGDIGKGWAEVFKSQAAFLNNQLDIDRVYNVFFKHIVDKDTPVFPRFTPTEPDDDFRTEQFLRSLLPAAADFYKVMDEKQRLPWGQNLIRELANVETDAFLARLKGQGRTTETDFVLSRIFGATAEDIAQFFAPPTEAPVLPALTWLDKVGEIMDNPAKLIPFVSSGVEIVTLGRLLKTAVDLEAGREVSEGDLLALKEYVDRSQRDTTWGNQVMGVLTNLVPFAGEFILTGGIFSLGKAAGVRAAVAALKRIATKTGLKLIEGRLAKLGIEVAGILAGGTLRAIPTGVARVPADTIRQQLQGKLTGDEEPVWQSAIKALGSNWVEVVSESTGGLFTQLAAPIKGQLVKLGLFQAFQKANPTKSIDDISRIMQRIGYDGVLAEMLEERVADVGHGILAELGLGDQKFQLPSLEQLSVELVSFAVPGVAMRAMESIKLPPGVGVALKDERGFLKLPGREGEDLASVDKGIADVRQELTEARETGASEEIERLTTQLSGLESRREELLREAPVTPGVTKEEARLTARALKASQTIKANPSILEGNLDSLSGNSKAITDFFKSASFGKQGLGGLDVPTQRLVLNRMLASLHQPEIRQAVIKSIPVDVVDDLIGLKLPANVLLHKSVVNKDALTVLLEGDVSLRTDVANALIRRIARLTTKKQFRPLQAVGNTIEGVPAIRATDIWHDVSIAQPGLKGKPEVLAAQAGRAAPTEAARPAPTGIPAMITRDMEARLRAMGITETELRQMTPQQAWERLGGMPEAVPTIPPSLTEGPPPGVRVAEPSVPPTAGVPPPVSPPTIIPPGGPLPPPPSGATRRVLDRIQMESTGENFTEKFRRGYHQFNVKMVDDLYAIKKFTEQATKGGVELSIEENPYMLARLLKGISGKANVFIDQGTFGKRFWKLENGKAVPNFTGESLESILTPVREVGVWQDFSTYLVARRSVELADRGIETGITKEDASAAIRELESKHRGFPNLAQRLYKYQDSLLVYGREMGLLSEDLLNKLRKYGDYVPFYRVFNELQSKGFMGQKMANIASPIKRIKGSEREIINPLESILKNTYVMIGAADRNQVGIMMANLVDRNPELAEVFQRVKTPMARVAGVTAKELGVEIEGMSEEDAEAVVDIFRPSFFIQGDEVTVLIDGKKAYFRVDSDLRDGLLALDRESLGMIGRFVSLPAKWLRAGATLSPDFMVRNPARDALSAFAYSNYGFLPGVDFLRGVAGIIRKDADYQLFRVSGAEHSMLVSLDREYLHKTFSEVVRGKKFTDYVKHPLELLQIGSELGEKATRLGEFKAGIRRGAVPLEAGYSARNVTLDFAQAGTTAHAMNRLIAFFNANIRGQLKMISAFKEHPVRTSVKVFAGITLPSILLYYANRDDDRWKEIPQWQKDIFWIVMTEDHIYRIPKPFELGILFGSVPERFLEWLDGKDSRLMKEVLLNAVDAGTPGVIPTFGLPIIEWMTNYNFFRGHGIVPASREKMPPELQYTRWTSEVSKKLGELLNQSPAKIDNLIAGWTGGLGRYATDVLDTILKKTGVSSDIPEPSRALADFPVLKAFVVRNPYGSSGETVERFYDILEKYEQGEKYLQEMLKLGEKDKFEKYKADHPELVFFLDYEKDVFYSASARYLRRVARDLSELSKKQNEIYKSTTMSPEEKRAKIDEIDVLKTDVAHKALDLLLGKKPQLLQDSINEAINRLGKEVEELPTLSLVRPDIFDTKNLYTEFGNILEAATKEDLSKLTGIDPLAFAYLEVKEIKKTSDPLLNKRVYEIELDLKEGVTSEAYFKAWQDGLIKDNTLSSLTRRQAELLRKYLSLDKVEQKQFLKDNPELSIHPRNEWLKSHPKENAQLAVFGQAKILSLQAYKELQRLLKELDIPDDAMPELTLPPESSKDTHFKYEDMVAERKHGSWEAQLLLLKDAEAAKEAGVQSYAEWRELTLSDTPMAALELKVKHRDLFDLRDAYSDKDSADYLDDVVKDADGLTARDRAIAKLKADNPDWVDDMRRIEAIENKATDYLKTLPLPPQPEGDEWILRPDEIPPDPKLDPGVQEYHSLGLTATQYNQVIDAWIRDHPDTLKAYLEQGERFVGFGWITDPMQFVRLEVADVVGQKVIGLTTQKAHELTDKLFPGLRSRFAQDQEGKDLIVEAWVERGKLIDKFGGSSSEAKVWLIDHPEIHKWALEQELLTDEGEKWNTPVLRINAKWRKEDKEYQAILDKFGGREEAVATEAYLAEHEDYRKDRRRRDAYELTGARGERFPDAEIETYVDYYELSIKGFRQERFLLDNPDFAQAMHEVAGIDLPDPTKVPSIEYDNIYDQYADQFDELEGNADFKSKYYIEDTKARAARDKELRFDESGKYTEFGLAELRRNGYGLFVPENHIENYVAYGTIIGEGKPENWTDIRGSDLPWYEDDWWMIDHPDYYQEVYLDLLKSSRKDYRKVPTREVFALYRIYLDINPKDVKARKAFRVEHPDLDEWGKLAGIWVTPTPA